MRRIVNHSSALLLLLLLTRGLGRAAPPPPLPGTLPRLHAQGTDIVDGAGRPVTLRGINLGGWLVEEMWMQPFVTAPPPGSAFPPIKDHVSLWRTVESRLGTPARDRVRAAFRASWLDESDFKRLHEAGFNCVRLPFLASLVGEPGGLAWLDRATGWANANGIYVILDLHGAPGGQSDQGHTGEADVNAFFRDPANVARAASLWTRLARHFRDAPGVAGYDTLNEPTGTPNSDTLYVVQDRLYRAIRAADPAHLVFIEDGYTGVQWMPFPGPAGWTDVVYSTHYYDFDAKTADDQQKALDAYLLAAVRERDRRRVPFYVGEYGLEPNGTPLILTDLLNTLADKRLSSSLWTYKVVRTGGGQSLWSLYGSAQPVMPLDPFRDSEAEMVRKCAQWRTDRLTLNAGMAQALRAAAPPAPAAR